MDRVHLYRNAAVGELYEMAIKYEGAVISSSGALINYSGKKTGRSPKDKRIVYEDTSKDEIWWGPVNVRMDEHTFEINRERAIDYLNTRDNVYVFDGFAGWDPKYRIKVRVICARAYHALFMRNSEPSRARRSSRSRHHSDLVPIQCSSALPTRSSKTLAIQTLPFTTLDSSRPTVSPLA